MRRREAIARVGEPMTLAPRDLAAGRAQGEEIRVAAVEVLRGAVPAGLRRVRVEVIDDDAGGPYRNPPREAFGDALRERGVELAEDGARVVLVFCDVKSWKCRAGLAPENQALLARLADGAAAVVLFGHARRLGDVPGTAPVLCAWTGDTGMQAAAARRLAG